MQVIKKPIIKINIMNVISLSKAIGSVKMKTALAKKLYLNL